MEKLQSYEALVGLYKTFGEVNTAKIVHELLTEDATFVQYTTGLPTSGTWTGTAMLTELFKKDVESFNITKMIPKILLADEKQLFSTVEFELKMKQSSSGIVHHILISQYFVFDPTKGKFTRIEEWFDCASMIKDLQHG